MTQSRLLKLNQSQLASGTCVVYVMARDQRVHDNHALAEAQRSALAHKLPLVVAFNLLPASGNRTREQCAFMLDGLELVEKELHKHHIAFVLTEGRAASQLPLLFEQLQPAEVYFDFSPLRGPRQTQKAIAAQIKVPCYVVDTHNIIPVWVASDKEEFAAHTMRSKVHAHLESWLVEPPKLQKHPHEVDIQLAPVDWGHIRRLISGVRSSGIRPGFVSGEQAAREQLEQFVGRRLSGYAALRNVPTEDGQSNLSPYLHFGQISSLRVALRLLDEVDSEAPLLLRQAKLASAGDPPTRMDGINAMLEEMIVRKELADNYCFYNANYDRLAGAKQWARDSLELHRQDPRDHLYTQQQWEQATTHDDAWNAAQLEMMTSGKMHGYMRMYWAKKLLEWSASPEEAVATAVYLNDKYSIDGGDPNGYVGILWSIAGLHDRPWFERSVYGKIRYMNRSGLARRFDVDEYVRRWTGQR